MEANETGWSPARRLADRLAVLVRRDDGRARREDEDIGEERARDDGNEPVRPAASSCSSALATMHDRDCQSEADEQHTGGECEDARVVARGCAVDGDVLSMESSVHDREHAEGQRGRGADARPEPREREYRRDAGDERDDRRQRMLADVDAGLAIQEGSSRACSRATPVAIRNTAVSMCGVTGAPYSGRNDDRGAARRLASAAMRRAVLFAVDGDAAGLRAVERELLERYARDYDVVCLASAKEARTRLGALAGDETPVALVLAAEVLAGGSGPELLADARHLHPHAKRALLIGWGEWGDSATGDAISEATVHGHIDHYLVRPLEPPDEAFHQAISSFLLEWAEDQRVAPHAVRVVGDAWSGGGTSFARFSSAARSPTVSRSPTRPREPPCSPR